MMNIDILVVLLLIKSEKPGSFKKKPLSLGEVVILKALEERGQAHLILTYIIDNVSQLFFVHFHERGCFHTKPGGLPNGH